VTTAGHFDLVGTYGYPISVEGDSIAISAMEKEFGLRITLDRPPSRMADSFVDVIH
jgi:hypothetical protein